jgi:hypothetical protein
MQALVMVMICKEFEKRKIDGDGLKREENIFQSPIGIENSDEQSVQIKELGLLQVDNHGHAKT